MIAMRAALIALAALGFGCDEVCLFDSECGAGALCAKGGRCTLGCARDEECALACDGPPECCDTGVCDGDGRCTIAPAIDPLCAPPAIADGWDAPIGTGAGYVVNQIAIAGRSRGFDLDGLCDAGGDCIDNLGWRFGELGNDQIRQGLLGGESL